MRAYALQILLCLSLGTNSRCKPKDVPQAEIYPEDAVILCFHDIGRQGRYAITKADFNRILDMLTDYQVVSFDTWVAGGLKQAVVLTFDDGYAAHREIVLPELLRRKFGATFYFYADQLKRDKTWQDIMKHPPSGISFGSHSWSHSLMRELPYAELFRELYLARTYLESVSGRQILSFAWPYGFYPDTGIVAARDAGFRFQLSVDYRVAKPADAARVIPRFTIFGKDPVGQVQGILSHFRPERPAGSGR